MHTRGRVAVIFGASWDATVSSPAKLRWSRNLKRDSRACRSTSKRGARVLRVAAAEAKSSRRTSRVRRTLAKGSYAAFHRRITIRLVVHTERPLPFKREPQERDRVLIE